MAECPMLSVAHAKLVDYLLNLDHPVGGSKARFLLKHGFRRDNPEVLAAALIRHAQAGWPGSLSPGSRALLNVIAGPLQTPSGTEPTIRTVWEAAQGSAEARFITAYPG